MLLSVMLCFKGMALMQRYNEVMKEKEALEQIVDAQQKELNEVEKMLESDSK